MARFPDREAQIKALAQNIVTGLTENVADFPAPPVAALDLQALLDSFIQVDRPGLGRQGRADGPAGPRLAPRAGGPAAGRRLGLPRLEEARRRRRGGRLQDRTSRAAYGCLVAGEHGHRVRGDAEQPAARHRLGVSHHRHQQSRRKRPLQHRRGCAVRTIHCERLNRRGREGTQRIYV